MTGTIKVNPEVMAAKADEFRNLAEQIRNLTNQMTEKVNSFSCFWQSDSSGAFVRKFRTLNDDFQIMYYYIKEHSDDLKEMARNYKVNETQNQELINGLAEEVF